MVSANVPLLSNKISRDIPDTNAVMQAVMTQQTTALTNLPVGATRWVFNSEKTQLTQQYWTGSAWVTPSMLMMNVDSVDGYHATVVKQANTIPVRDALGRVNADLNGNALTANTAQTLTETLPVFLGGSGGSTPEEARVNLGVVSDDEFNVLAAVVADAQNRGQVGGVPFFYGNIDELFTTGNYQINGNAGTTGTAPIGMSVLDGLLMVYNHHEADLGWLRQVLITTSTIFLRVYHAGAWLAWAELARKDYVDAQLATKVGIGDTTTLRGIELFPSLHWGDTLNGGYIDFHYNNNNSVDFTTRIIELAHALLIAGKPVELSNGIYHDGFVIGTNWLRYGIEHGQITQGIVGVSGAEKDIWTEVFTKSGMYAVGNAAAHMPNASADWFLVHVMADMHNTNHFGLIAISYVDGTMYTRKRRGDGAGQDTGWMRVMDNRYLYGGVDSTSHEHMATAGAVKAAYDRAVAAEAAASSGKWTPNYGASIIITGNQLYAGYTAPKNGFLVSGMWEDNNGQNIFVNNIPVGTSLNGRPASGVIPLRSGQVVRSAWNTNNASKIRFVPSYE